MAEKPDRQNPGWVEGAESRAMVPREQVLKRPKPRRQELKKPEQEFSPVSPQDKENLPRLPGTWAEVAVATLFAALSDVEAGVSVVGVGSGPRPRQGGDQEEQGHLSSLLL